LADDIEVLRTALLETSASGGALIAWIEAPVSRDSVDVVRVLRAYYDVLENLSRTTTATIITAFQLTELSEEALRASLQASQAMVSAKSIVPHHPSWQTPQAKVDLTPMVGIPMHLVQHAAVDAAIGPMSQSEKLAELGQLAAGVAHELGNPLSIISSSLQYLHRRLADAGDPASDFAMSALQNVERMHGLLNNMLDFASARKPRPVQVDLKEATSEVLHFVAAECVRRKIAVEVAFDPSLPKAWVDPRGFKQIVLNLVKNALEAIALGGTTLRLRTRGDGRGKAVVEVENDGPAIPAEVMSNIFRPFHTTKDDGTGLGLYLSRQMARDQGGDLEVENAQNAVRFRLTVPLDQRMGEGECRTS
jgi:signal transduction histidine kinase